MPEKCKISDWGCIYHACMSDHCQKNVMLDQGFNAGPGECELSVLTTKDLQDIDEAEANKSGTII